MKKRVFIIEDEPGMIMALSDCLVTEGYLVETAVDGDQGLRRALEEHFDIIILDLMLPARNGFDVCRELRLAGKQTPVLMLTARGETVDKVVGLKLGADDYVTKPFEMVELLARVEALLRRVGAAVTCPDVYRFGTVTVDFQRTEAWRAGNLIELSPREFKLLRYLIERRGLTVSRDELLNGVWGYDATPTTRTVDVHVAQLRQKLEDNPRDPQVILTIYGFGYKFVG